MKKRVLQKAKQIKKFAICFFVLVVLLLFYFLPPSAFAQVPIQSALTSGLNWLTSHQNSDGSFGEKVPLRDTPLAIEVISSLDPANPSLTLASAWEATQAISNNDFLARKIKAFKLLSLDALIDVQALLATQNADGGVGLASGYQSDVLDTALSLEALSVAQADIGKQKSAFNFLITSQNTDGGWGLEKSKESSIFLTSQALLSLSAFRDNSGFVTQELNNAISSGADWLESKQNTDGSFGQTLYQTAYAFLALAETDSTFNTSETLDYLLSQQKSNGSFNDNPFETALCLLALKKGEINATVDSVQVSSTAPLEGNVVAVTAKATNAGSNQIRNLKVRFYVGHPEQGGIPVGQDQVISTLLPGEQKELTINLDTLGYAGPTSIYAKADPDNTLFETNEADNLSSATLNVNSIPSVPVLASPPDGQAANQKRPTFYWGTSTDRDGNPLTYQLQLDKSSTFDSGSLRTYSGISQPGNIITFTPSTTQALTDATWYWRARATDGVLNSAWAEPYSLIVDSTSPTISSVSCSPTIISPNNDGIKESLTISYALSENSKVTINLLNQSNQVVRILESDALKQSENNTAVWDGKDNASVPVADGIYKAQIKAADDAGNFTIYTVQNLQVDTTLPQISNLSLSLLTFSPNGNGYYETISLSYNLSENATVTARFFNSKGVLIRADTTKANPYTWDGKNYYGTYVQDGNYTIQLTAEDGAGNRSPEASCEVAIKTSPEIGSLLIDPNPVRPETTVTLALSIHDDTTAAVTIAGATYNLTDADGDGILSVDIIAPSATGNYVTTLTATDSLRNTKVVASNALVVIPKIMTGQAWIQDTQADFKGSPPNTSTCSSVSADAISGSIVLSSNGWEEKTPMPTSRYSAASCLGPDGKLYVFGGYYIYAPYWTWVEYPVKANEAYNPATNSWESKADMPSYRKNAQAVLAPNGKIYVIGGDELVHEYRGSVAGWVWAAYPTNMVEAYDPATNSWERDTNHGGTLAPMPTSRSVFGMATGPDGKIYCVGGYTGLMNDGGSTDVVEAYDPITNTWETRNPMPQPQCCFASAGDDGKIDILEGEYRRNYPDGSLTHYNLNNVWKYDIAQDTWEPGSPSPLSREEAACAKGIDGKIYVYGGLLNSSPTNRNLAYDPSGDAWQEKEPMLHGFALRAGAADLSGKIYAIGGHNASQWYPMSTNSVERFDPLYQLSGTFTSVSKDFSREAAFGQIYWEAEIPEGTSLTFNTRTSNDGINWSSWSEDYVTGGSLVTSPGSRYLQYRVRYTTGNPLMTPRLDKATIVYNLAPSTPATVYSVTSSVDTPTLKWTNSTDPEGDPIDYEVDVDTANTFNSTGLKVFKDIVQASGSQTTFVVPPECALADGKWYYRVRTTDGHTFSPWSSIATADIDTAPPTISSFNISPPVMATYGTTRTAAAIAYTISETCTVYLTADSKNWTFNNQGPGDYSVNWDGTNNSGTLVSDGVYPVKVEATDSAGNKAAPVTGYVTVRRAPAIKDRPWCTSNPADPQASCLLNVKLTGSPTKVTALLEGKEILLTDPERDGTYSGAVLSPNQAGAYHVPEISAFDETTGNEAVCKNMILEAPGYVATLQWTQTSYADFYAGSKTDLNFNSAPDSVGLVENYWRTEDTTISSARYGMASCVAGDQVYLFGDGNQAEAINLETKSRESLAPMPTPRAFAAAALGADGKIYVFGGQGASSYLATVEAYDPLTNSWESKTPMTVPRRAFAAFSGADGKIYIMGGENASGSLSSVQTYDPQTNVWETKSPMSVAVSHMAACAANDKFYLFGGNGQKNTVQSYDPATNSWEIKTPLPTWKTDGAAALGSDGKIYVFGGLWSGSYSSREIYAYNPDSDTWQQKNSFTKSRAYASAASYEGKLYVIGGYTRELPGWFYIYYSLNTIESYDPLLVGTLVSTVKDTGQISEWGKIGWTALLQPSTHARLQTRSSLDNQTWSNWSEPYQPGAQITSPTGRYIQYKATLETTDSPNTPILSDVTIGYKKQKMTAPTTLSPVDDATIFTQTPTLSWQNSTGSTNRRYELQLDISDEFNTLNLKTYTDIPETSPTSCLYVPTIAPLADATWYWRVRAADTTDCSAWSTTSSFSVVTQPDLSIDAADISFASEDAEEGDVVTVSATIHNTGAPAENVKVRFFDGGPSAGGTQLGDEQTINSLGYDQTTTLQLDYDTLGKAGLHEVYVIIDPDNRIVESNEASNQTSKTLSVLSNGLSITPTTDKSTYATNENVQITLTAGNQGTKARDLSALVEITDSAGNLVELVDVLDLSGFIPGDVRILRLAWNTGALYAGEYKVQAYLRENDRALAQGESTFTITPDLSIDSKVTVDKIVYSANENVTVASKVVSKSANFIFENLKLKTSITAPDSSAVFTKETTIPVLNLEERKVFGYNWNTVQSTPGLYQVKEEIFLLSGELLSMSETSFTALSSAETGAGLSGSLEATPSQVHQGEAFTLTYALANSGNADLTDLPLTLILADPETTSVVKTITDLASLAINSTYSQSVNINSAELPLVTDENGKHFLGILQAEVGGETLALASAPIKVMPILVSSTVQTDASEYDCKAPVSITVNATNNTTDYPLADLTANVSILNPSDIEIYANSASLDNLVFAETKAASFGWNTAKHLPGKYQVKTEIVYRGMLISQSDTTFTVLSTADTGTSLEGTITPASGEVHQGELLTADYTIVNEGNAVVSDLPIQILLIDPATGEIIKTLTSQASIAQNQTYSSQIQIDTNELPQITDPEGKDLTLKLKVDVPRRTIDLASSQVKIIPGLLIELEISKEATSMPRILVWAESEANLNLAQTTLERINSFYKIVTTDVEFLKELRSGIYTTFVILDTKKPLTDHFDEELAEKVNAGATLIGSRWANMDNFKQMGVFGVKFEGYLPPATYAVPLIETTYTLAGNLTANGSIQKLTPQGAAILASTTVQVGKKTLTYPAVTVNTYGRGKAAFYAFDLSTASGSTPSATDLLERALRQTCPDGLSFTALDVVPVAVTVQNQGIPVNLKVEETVSQGTIVQAMNAQSLSANSATWDITLDNGQTQTLYYLFRLPETKGEAVLTTTISYEAGGVWKAYGTSELKLVVDRDIADLLSEAMAKTNVLAPTTTQDEQAKARVIGTLVSLETTPPITQTDYESAIFNLVEAVDDLAKVSVDTSEARLPIDGVLSFYEEKWYNF